MKTIFAALCAKLQHVLTKQHDGDEDEDADDDDDDDENEAIVANGLMNCLIQYKHHPMMDEKCRSGIEHHQLVSDLLTYSVSFLE